MSLEPDLSHAISLQPRPFHTHPLRLVEEVRPRSASAVSNRNTTPSSKNGVSTAIEATTPPEQERNDPIARHTPVIGRGADEEGQRLPRYTLESDPYALSSKIKTDTELDLIRANTARKRDGFGSITTSKEATKARRVQGFYTAQNENIQRLLRPVDEHRRYARQTAEENQLKVRIAVYGSFVANIVLACLQLYAAVASGSLSIFTTMADSIFDPLSNLTLILAGRAINRVDPRRFPSGKARIETASNIVFCFLMCAVSFIIIVMSARALAEGGDESGVTDFHLPPIIAVSIAFATKLSLFLYCWALRKQYSQVRILWEDHRNDLFINGFGIMTSVLGSKIVWYIDPAGAIVLSFLISFLWLRTAYSEFQLLIGVSASPQFLQHITYISMTHSSLIQSLDTVRAWHSGPRLIVEVDIVMDAGRTLRETHDVAEELQTKLESLPDVERAYVHVDYETSHQPEHFLKKEL